MRYRECMRKRINIMRYHECIKSEIILDKYHEKHAHLLKCSYKLLKRLKTMKCQFIHAKRANLQSNSLDEDMVANIHKICHKITKLSFFGKKYKISQVYLQDTFPAGSPRVPRGLSADSRVLSAELRFSGFCSVFQDFTVFF